MGLGSSAPTANGRSAEFPLIAPPHTPFGGDGSLALDVVTAQAQWLAADGVGAVFLAGSTGEGLSLTVSERKALVEAWVDAAPSAGLKTIVNVGHNSQQAAIELARHARAAGADAVAGLTPFYLRPRSVTALVDFLQPIAAAADLPFYYYDIPALTHVNLPLVDFLGMAEQRLPTLAGIKYSNPDLVQLQSGLQFAEGRWKIYFGIDEMLLAAWALGVHGAIGSTYNFAASLARRVVDSAEQGDWRQARQTQQGILARIQVLAQVEYVAACKWLMTEHGVDCGAVRPPLSNLTPEQTSDLAQAWAQFEHASTQGLQPAEGLHSTSSSSVAQ